MRTPPKELNMAIGIACVILGIYCICKQEQMMGCLIVICGIICYESREL